MSTVSVRTCKLDNIGIPDLSDLQDLELDLRDVNQVDTLIVTDDTNLEQPAYYPLAVVHRLGKLIFVPLDRETDCTAANHSLTILRSALRPRCPKTISFG